MEGCLMAKKPTYEELEQRVKELDKQAAEHKRTEKELKREKERAEQYLNIAEIGLVIVASNEQITQINKKGCEILKYNQEELIGKNWFEVLVPSSMREEVRGVFDQLMAGNVEPIEFYENPLLTKDGEERLIAFHNTVIRDQADQIVGVLFSAEDITERKLAEEALKESEGKLSAMLQSIGDHMSMMDKDLNILWANDMAKGLFGDDTIGKKCYEVYHGRDKPCEPSPCLTLKAFEDGQVHKHETLVQTPDGRTLAYACTASVALRDDEGNPTCVIEVSRDITEHKQAEVALRESEEKYRSMMEAMEDPVYICSPEFHIEYMNPAMIKRTGRDATRESCYKVINGLEKKCPWCIHDKVQQGEYHMTEIINPKDGLTYSVLHSPIHHGDGTISKLTIYRDITEMKNMAQQLQRSKKMESLGLLAGGVAHDLNNVLSGIVSYPELILMNLPEDSKLRKPIETMQESGHRAVAIVQDLLTVARGVATTKEPLNLNDLVSEYLNSPEFKKLKQFHPTVTIKTNLDTDLLNIGGSHVHIRKVVMNLVSNALEAIEGSGNVTISSMNRYIDRRLRGYDDVNIGEYAVLVVLDDGSGISSDDLERIFEPFYTKKVMGRSGTGLGLAVVWNVVQDHKGYIDVISDKNGTTFELYFPITRDEISDKVLSIPIKDYKGNGETILVVDDVESQREISCKMLDTLGYKTKAVSSGEEAVEYLKENTVDLILLDMIMDPGINGRETYERIIKIHPKQKAIIVSGFAETDEVKEAQKLGAGKYIKKPVTLEKIGLAIKEELEK
jgi:PAS domain S-box-containing protein